MADKYNKKGKSALTWYLFEFRQFQQSLCRGMSGFLMNSSTRTPTFFGWLFLIGLTFLLATYFLGGKKDVDRENPDISEYRARKIVVNKMLPQVPGPDMQEAEFKAVHENNMKKNAEPKFPIFDPNKHENPAHKRSDQEQVDRFGFPNPKAAVRIIASPNEECRDLTLLILINSHPAQTGARLAIRKTWGVMPEGWTGLQWRTVFIVGQANTKFDKMAEDEATEHGDMLIGDLNDSPLEGTRKFILGMKWTADKFSNCMPEFVLKSDEKVYINVNVILPWLEEKFTGISGIYMGRLQRNDIPVRDPEDPHHVIRADYPPDVYPDYNQAPVYMFSQDVVIKLTQVMRRATPINVEDAFVGILAEKAGIISKHNDHFQMLRKPSNECHFLSMFFIFNTMPNEHFQITKKLIDGKKKCGDVRTIDARKGFHKHGDKIRGLRK